VSVLEHSTIDFSHSWLLNSLADLVDADFVLAPLDPELFPGVSPSVMVHNGFASSQSKYDPISPFVWCCTLSARYRSAADILSAVQRAIAVYGTDSVHLVGHSLGAYTLNLCLSC